MEQKQLVQKGDRRMLITWHEEGGKSGKNEICVLKRHMYKCLFVQDCYAKGAYYLYKFKFVTNKLLRLKNKQIYQVWQSHAQLRNFTGFIMHFSLVVHFQCLMWLAMF